MKIYVAGPMRGYKELNYPAFDNAAMHLRYLGHEPVSPADLDRATGVSIDNATTEEFVAGALRRDFAALVTCDAIAFLPGWKDSVGANAERRVALDIGLPLYDITPNLGLQLQTDGYQVIGISGYARSGKDTIAEHFISQGWERIAFADTLREALYTLNPIVMALGSTHRLANIVDKGGWDHAKSWPEVRSLLQRMGTDVGRQLLGDNVWVDLALRKLEPGHKYIFTDVRFPNEAAAIQKAGGQMWRVERPDHGPINGHISETALDQYPFDLRLTNDGTVADLHKWVEFAMQANGIAA